MLFEACRKPESRDTASILAIDDHYGRVILCAWNEATGQGSPRYWNRDEAAESIRHTSPDLLRLDDAKARFRQFTEAV